MNVSDSMTFVPYCACCVVSENCTPILHILLHLRPCNCQVICVHRISRILLSNLTHSPYHTVLSPFHHALRCTLTPIVSGTSPPNRVGVRNSRSKVRPMVHCVLHKSILFTLLQRRIIFDHFSFPFIHRYDGYDARLNSIC